jgi:hypothetical protein
MMEINIPTVFGYLLAVTLLVIGVSVSTSEKSEDSASTLSAKRITATFFILFSVIVAMFTYFYTREGGLFTNFFGQKNAKVAESEPFPQTDCAPEAPYSDSPF